MSQATTKTREVTLEGFRCMLMDKASKLDSDTLSRLMSEQFQRVPHDEKPLAISYVGERFVHRKPKPDDVRIAGEFLAKHADKLPCAVTSAVAGEHDGDLHWNVTSTIDDRIRDLGWRAIVAVWELLDRLEAETK